MEQINKSEAVYLQTTAVTVNSARGQHIAEIIDATDGTLSATLPLSYKHPTEDRSHTPEELDEITASITLCQDRVISAAGDLPSQFSGQLYRWGAKLIEMAERVDRITPQSFKGEPVGYRAVDVDSGKPIRESCLYAEARRAGEGHERETGRAYRIDSGPLEELPKALADYRARCNEIDQRDVYEDELSETLTPLV